MDNFGDVLDFIDELNINEDDKYDIKYLYERAYYTNMCNTLLNNKCGDYIMFVEKGIFSNNILLSYLDIRIEYIDNELMDSIIYFPKKLFDIKNIKCCYKKYLFDKRDKKRMRKIIKKCNNNVL